MRRNYKNQRKKSLLAKTLETLKESDYDNNYDKLNKKLFQKTFNKNLNRNSSSKIFSYNQKKYIRSFINDKDNKDYSKNILNKI